MKNGTIKLFAVCQQRECKKFKIILKNNLVHVFKFLPQTETNDIRERRGESVAKIKYNGKDTFGLQKRENIKCQT